MCITSPQKTSPLAESRRMKRDKPTQDNASNLAIPNGAEDETKINQTVPTDGDVEAAQESSKEPSPKKQRTEVERTEVERTEVATAFSHVVAVLQAGASVAQANMPAATQAATQGGVEGGVLAAVGIAALNGLAYMMTGHAIKQVDSKVDALGVKIGKDMEKLNDNIEAKIDTLIAEMKASQATPVGAIPPFRRHSDPAVRTTPVGAIPPFRRHSAPAAQATPVDAIPPFRRRSAPTTPVATIPPFRRHSDQ